MKFDGVMVAGDRDGDGAGWNTVVVAVTFDDRSRELLTWSIENAARFGDRVIVLHVLETALDSTASLFSLLKSFNSMLSEHEGLCKWKQVDLKLKVCRGSTVKQILVRETKSCGAACLVVGTSRTRHAICSAASVAKYCSKKLPKSLRVFAVDGGKIVFQRKPSATSTQDDDLHRNLLYSRRQPKADKNRKVSGRSKELNLESTSFRKLSLMRMITGRVPSSDTPVNSHSQSLNEFHGEESMETPPGTSGSHLPSDSTLEEDASSLKSRVASFRRLFTPQRQNSNKSSSKMSLVRRMMRFGRGGSTAAIYPDLKPSRSHQHKNFASELDEDDGAGGCESFRCGFDDLPDELRFIGERYQPTCKLFSYQELLSATSNFSPANIIGKGGSSHVYKGRLSNGKDVAVKILKPSSDVFKDFVHEIEIAGSLHHKNVISQIGFCFEDNHLLLVYEFSPKGSLEENLHGVKKDPNAFSWLERNKVAIGVAEALDYLHNGHDPPVIHRDVKSSNILLCKDFEPKLSDFGLATLASHGSPLITSTDVTGTFGYLAPEYVMHGQISDKADVYAFGIVLLELLSGRKAINGQQSLIMWVKPILETGKLSQLLDPSVASNYDKAVIERMVLAATLCIRRSPKLRPRISLVLKLLRGDADTINWARQQVGDAAFGKADDTDEEAFCPNMESHLNLALLDLEDDSD